VPGGFGLDLGSETRRVFVAPVLRRAIGRAGAAAVGGCWLGRAIINPRLVSSGWSMSALPPKEDIRERIEYVCFVPKADICGGAGSK
jgi:hypothetical protein